MEKNKKKYSYTLKEVKNLLYVVKNDSFEAMVYLSLIRKSNPEFFGHFTIPLFRYARWKDSRRSVFYLVKCCVTDKVELVSSLFDKTSDKEYEKIYLNLIEERLQTLIIEDRKKELAKNN